jgi:teichuronic acid exporter
LFLGILLGFLIYEKVKLPEYLELKQLVTSLIKTKINIIKNEK